MRYIIVLLVLIGTCVGAEGTLEKVKRDNQLTCGVSADLPGFSQNSGTHYKGFEVDFCRAIAAAVLGDSNKVNYVPVTTLEQSSYVLSGKVDVLISNTTWNSGGELELNFTSPIFYDTQGLMVPIISNIRSISDISNQQICLVKGVAEMDFLGAMVRLLGLETRAETLDTLISNTTDQILSFEDEEQALTAYLNNECEVILANTMFLLLKQRHLLTLQGHIILPEAISKAPLSLAVNQGDDVWFDVVRWTVFATFLAEEYGIDSTNVDKLAKTNSDPNVERLLGQDDGKVLGQLGLAQNAFYNVIAQVGNYAEIYDSNLGASTPIALERGYNALYTNGGLLYAPPMR